MSISHLFQSGRSCTCDAPDHWRAQKLTSCLACAMSRPGHPLSANQGLLKMDSLKQAGTWHIWESCPRALTWFLVQTAFALGWAGKRRAGIGERFCCTMGFAVVLTSGWLRQPLPVQVWTILHAACCTSLHALALIRLGCSLQLIFMLLSYWLSSVLLGYLLWKSVIHFAIPVAPLWYRDWIITPILWCSAHNKIFQAILSLSLAVLTWR